MSHCKSPEDTIAEEQQLTSNLLELLAQEQVLLLESKIERLPQLTDEKAKILTRLAELSSWRHRCLAAAGFKPTEVGMRAWLNIAPSKNASKLWSELVSSARSAKELNRTNGLLINKHISRNQSALQILQGQPQGNGFYGPDGQTSVKTGALRNLVVG